MADSIPTRNSPCIRWADRVGRLRAVLPAIQPRAVQQVQIRFRSGRGILRAGAGSRDRRTSPGTRARPEAADDLLSLRLRPDRGNHARPQALAVLNTARARHGISPAPLVQVDRIRPCAGDYGMLSAQDRDRHMAANSLSFRRFRPDQVRGAHLLVIDDVRVTGAHQRCMARASDALPLASRTFLYIAAFPSPQDGCFDPTREDALNHAAIKTLDDLAGLVTAAGSPGTCGCASPSSTRPTTAICRGSSARCPTGSSATCTATATGTATPGWARTPRATRLSTRSLAGGPARRSQSARPGAPPDSPPWPIRETPRAGSFRLIDARHERPVADALSPPRPSPPT